MKHPADRLVQRIRQTAQLDPELAVNPRSSSAKLRAVEKIAEATGS